MAPSNLYLHPSYRNGWCAIPVHFEIKHFANSTGARRIVVKALATSLGASIGTHRMRVGNVLTVVSQLVATLRKLDNYSLRTSTCLNRPRNFGT